MQHLVIVGSNPSLRRQFDTDEVEEDQSAERDSEKDQVVVDEEDIEIEVGEAATDDARAEPVQSLFKDIIGQVNKVNEVLLVGSPEKAGLAHVGSPNKARRSGNKENVGTRSFQGSPSKMLGSPQKQATLGFNQDTNTLIYCMYNMILELKSQTAYLIEK